MAFLWLDMLGGSGQAEYARAYKRAIESGSIDSVISWELGGFRTEEGIIVTDAPEMVKENLRKDALYADAMRKVDAAVKGLREAHYISKLSAQLGSY